MMLDVDTRYAARRPWVPRPAQFARWAGVALARARQPTTLSICVVGAARSRSLNARYRGKPRPTNVLSFAGAGVGPDGRNDLGELVICAPVVAREAREQGKSRESHWAHMTVHGVLHLLGYDHEHRAEARKMAAVEVQLLDRMGFSDPYA
ncbi:MAG: rRNA maturation RNase YbeY [Steroidobacterales bacterium]